MSTDVALVVPSIRPDSLREFLRRWRPQFEAHKDHLLLVIFETNGPSDAARDSDVPCERVVLTQADVDKAWGADRWILPQTNSSCRCFGFWQAVKLGAQVIISQDDDAYPEGGIDVILAHSSVLEQRTMLGWCAIARQQDGTTFGTRGLPWKVRNKAEIMVNQGLWTGVPDVDAVTQFAWPAISCKKLDYCDTVPLWNFFPMSWMNVSFRREIMAAVCPPPSIMDKPTDRFDDTWTGICLKWCLDHMGCAATYGLPYVHHSRATDPFTNLEVEVRGMRLQEVFWQYVRDCDGECSAQVFDLSEHLAHHLLKSNDAYIRKVGESRLRWIDRWSEVL